MKNPTTDYASTEVIKRLDHTIREPKMILPDQKKEITDKSSFFKYNITRQGTEESVPCLLLFLASHPSRISRQKL